MERRSNIEIAAEILTIAEKGAKKTHIAYGANLNHNFLEKYLDRLEEQDLVIRNIQPGNRIQTTEKGLMFAQQFRTLTHLISL